MGQIPGVRTMTLPPTGCASLNGILTSRSLVVLQGNIREGVSLNERAQVFFLKSTQHILVLCEH